jgi:SAM-dependent methyltransferase
MSIGRNLLPAGLHQKLQLDRWFIHEFLRKNLMPNLRAGIRVLDAGSGRLPEQYLRNDILATGATLETLDFMAGPGVDHVGDVAAMPFVDGQYDFVVCTQVFEHVPDPRQACRELARVVKPGGQVIITVPQSAFLHNLPYHFFHCTNIGLRLLVEESGLEILAMEPQGGHFVNLAGQLHYTCRVIESTLTGKWKRRLLSPLTWCLRILLGFCTKVFLCYLDRKMPFPGNTQGWNCLCRKPAGM